MTALLPDIAGLAACPGTVQYNTGLTYFNNVLTTQRALFEQRVLIITFNDLKICQKSHRQVPVVRKRLPTELRQP